MKRLFLLLIFSLSITFVNAQTWAPLGAKWSFGLSCWDYPFTTYVDYEEWVSTDTVVLDGQTCSVIEGPGEDLVTYEDSNIVYWYHQNQFTVLYDFNKNAGESWTILNDTCDLIINVDSTGMETINGFALKTLYVSMDDPSFMGKIIQHIGHVGRPYPDFFFHCTGGIIEFGCSYDGLRCYEDTVFGFHNFNIAPSCDYYTVGIEDVVNPNLNIYPNPTNGVISITGLTDKATATIMDATGRVVLTAEVINNKVDVSAMAHGVYVLRIETAKGISNHRIIKQ